MLYGGTHARSLIRHTARSTLITSRRSRLAHGLEPCRASSCRARAVARSGQLSFVQCLALWGLPCMQRSKYQTLIGSQRPRRPSPPSPAPPPADLKVLGFDPRLFFMSLEPPDLMRALKQTRDAESAQKREPRMARSHSLSCCSTAADVFRNNQLVLQAKGEMPEGQQLLRCQPGLCAGRPREGVRFELLSLRANKG